MQIETVEVHAHPMLCITRTCSMVPDEIAKVMGEAFHALGGIIGKNGITPAGPPISVYREWDGKTMTFDVGFPVSEGDLGKASGEVKAGETPSGRALKAIHHGPYAKLQDSYAAFEKHMADAGMPEPNLTWEIYVNDPDSVPEDQLVTELYAALAE